MTKFDQPLWLVGFRPFFALACISGPLLPLLWVLLGAFLASIVFLLLCTLIRHRATDSYVTDNCYFIVDLPLFLLAHGIALTPDHFTEGWRLQPRADGKEH